MPRTILISREDGRALNTYGVKKVRFNMKFSFILSLVTVFLWCGTTTADTRVLNDLKYLEYLNDLDRRNVELDDIHKQWPFHNIGRTRDDEGEEGTAEQRALERERLLEVVNLARAELANKHNQNYPVKFFDPKETSDRADPLNQYRRYKPFEQEILEEARMYPERNEDEAKFNDDDNVYQNTDDIILDEEDEELTELRPTLPRQFFPRIAGVEKPSIYENNFQDSGESRNEDDAEDEPEEIPHIKPSFPKAYFPRIAPVDLPQNFKIDDIDFDQQSSYSDNNNMHHEHEDYQFKEGEEFPHSSVFNEAPEVKDPSEFAVGPTDPRFYRDIVQTGSVVTATSKQQDSIHPYLVKSSYVSKPKMNSRSDLQKQLQSLPSGEQQLETLVNKDVEMVPFKPDIEADTAGVYIIAIVAGISAAATVGLIAVGIGWYKCVNGRRRNTVDGCISE